MTSPVSLDAAFEALADCEVALERLHRTCCQPGRSPRMEALAETLARARRGLNHVDRGSGAVDAVLEQLEDAGAQIGSLQVGCCAPSRMPLYASMLTGLADAQRTIKKSTDQSLHG